MRGSGNANQAESLTTIDGLLNHRVQLEQPADGYRVAVDTVLLAAAVPARAGERILDLGCGAGGALLCLACRVPGISATGVEIQENLAQLCQGNIARNAFDAALDVRIADATRLPEDLRGAFDHVMMNPPYHDEARHDVSDDPARRAANTEKPGDLTRWIASSAQALKESGALTLIHRADRAEEILALLAPHFGRIEVLTVLPKAGAPPKRVILRAFKGGPQVTKGCKSLILHDADGGYTDAAEALLRAAAALEFTPAN